MPRSSGYGGDPRNRDGGYHQGTVWGWLLGPFVLAHLRVYKDPKKALEILEPFADRLRTYGVGSLGEIFDGDPPMAPRGCIAQAWTVAEALRAWTVIHDHAGMRHAKKTWKRTGPKRARGSRT